MYYLEISWSLQSLLRIRFSDFWIREMEGPRSSNHNLRSDSSENLVPRPGLVVTDVFNDYFANELMSYNFLRPETPSGDGIFIACFNAFFVLNP